jgi:hypothetical protein
MRVIFTVLCAAFLAPAQDRANGSWNLEVPGDRQWIDTNIDLQAGETVRITATGTLKYATSPREFGPEGTSRAWMDMLKQFPVLDANRGALIGRVGDRDTARGFLIGPKREYRVPAGGRLFLGVNQAGMDRASGSFQVRIERVAAALPPVSNVPVVEMTQQQIDSIPRRVVDKEGTPGDRVNFAVVGSEKQVKEALAKAGWTVVDRTTKDAVFRGILVSVSKQAYVTLPMSELLLFGRPQDFGYAQADPLQVVAARHHFRIWKAPFTVGGREVWAGAGTHDVGFDRDQRNGKITHRIDGEVDKEREFIGRSLLESGMVAKTGYLTPKDPVTQAKTAHGQSFSSDGRTLIVYLNIDPSDSSDHFSDYFCTVLRQNPDGGNWGDCTQYLDDNGKSDFRLPKLSQDYRILIVPGFMSSCFADSPAFLEGQESLRKRGLSVTLLPVPNDPSEQNAKMIGDYLRAEGPKDKRKFILIGYSKGTPDIQVALARENISPWVAAFISVAGASGGSVIADAIPDQADRFIRQYFKMDTCRGDVAAGFRSLRRSVRQPFLGAYPNLPVPTYSIVAFAEKSNTSKALVQTWEMLAPYDSKQDGQLTAADATIPGSKYLGALKGDHFSVALPFDKSADSTIRQGMDKTRFPRAALFESLLLFVMHDLGAQ